MYCSDDAYEEIRSMLSEYDHPESGIHFIDTGNYHYMSRIFTSFIESEYELVLLDHHTDMQDTAFGDILSCGSWVKEILEKDAGLVSVLVIGPSVPAEGGTSELLPAPCERITASRYHKKTLPEGSGTGSRSSDIPLYISIDKDVFAGSECVTNWDQGDLLISEAEGLLRRITSGRKVIGADICGGVSKSDPGYIAGTEMRNLASDIRLYELCRQFFD
ncbi:MAG: arginase family protein [Lachnospiraceae bacterium]|nr:arginase family protein [Lachnospiraceae bacterium]